MGPPEGRRRHGSAWRTHVSVRPPSGTPDPCVPNPCGDQTVCTSVNGRPLCTCLPGLLGTPQTGCREECRVSTDCAEHLACIGNKCVDPCQGACGIAAVCDVDNHRAVCACPAGYAGNPYLQCFLSGE